MPEERRRSCETHGGVSWAVSMGSMRTELVWQKRREAVGVVLPFEIAESTAGSFQTCKREEKT